MRINSTLRSVLASATIVTLLAAQLPAQQQNVPATQTQPFTLRVNSNIVLTNVVVRDKKTGAVVPGLKASDFTILENGKQQRIQSFDYQNVDQAVELAEKNTVEGSTSKKIADLLNNNFSAEPKELRDHRLMVFFFDLSSMQPEDIERAVDSATKFVNTQMQPADLVALVSLSTGLTMDQEFTSDKTILLRKLAAYNGDDSSAGLTAGSTTGTTDGTADDASSFVADDSEYAALNTDRELYAIQQIAKSLEHVDARKSMLYFSGGLTRQGIENQASMRVATNEAVKANMAIYAVDTRGLQALNPVGDASTGSLRGNSAYSGAAYQNQISGNFASQETLGTLASDTGGKLFTDSNDFAPAFQAIQHDTEAFYILGFRSTNQAQDGSFRHLTIKVNRPDVKLEYRPGYYAPADFQHAKTEDREATLVEQMRSDLPATDVPVYLQALYFRLAGGSGETARFYIPVSLIVPGSAIPFLQKGDKDKATLDVDGQIKDAQGIIVGNVRDTVNLNLNPALGVKQRNIQYSTGFTLAPGHYHLKFVVRENQTGQMGSFETDLNVPSFKNTPLKLSSIVLSSQRLPDDAKPRRGTQTDPLVRDGLKWVANIPHVFRQDQHLYFLYEVYDPVHGKKEKEPAPLAPSPGLGRHVPLGNVRVLTSIQFMLNGAKVYETPLVEATAINSPDQGAVAFQFDVPLTPLKPGTYICQVNVVDDDAGSFIFPRLALRITGSPAAARAPAASPTSSPTP
jgi:VWFA-related protein